MAACRKCRRGVDCSCTLIQGMCMTCYMKDKESNLAPFPAFDPNTTTISEVTQVQGMPREEQLRRINEILKNAKQLIKNEDNL